MIKVQATIVGKVKRGALLRTDKDGKNYLSYVVHVNVPAGDKKNKVMEIIMTLLPVIRREAGFSPTERWTSARRGRTIRSTSLLRK